jgi:hypothetical protein
MRPALALLAGIAVSMSGLLVVLATSMDLGGVLLIVAGSAVALMGIRRSAHQPR